MAPPPAPASGLRPAKAAHRYRKGQAPAGYHEDESSTAEESDGEEEELKGSKPLKKAPVAPTPAARRDGLQVITQSSGAPVRPIKVEVKTELGALPKEESSSEEETSDEEDAVIAPPKAVYMRPGGPSSQSAPTKEESSEYESGSEEEDESEEEVQRIPLYKPVFVSKRGRDTIKSANSALAPTDPEELELKRQQELEERRKQSKSLIAESIKREIADKEKDDNFPDVDDTDGLNPEEEFEEWKLRELMRLKRDKEAEHAREKEREEVEARRALPEALRLKEDTERAAALRAEKRANRGQRQFLQKYHHKGAFFADDEILQRYDYSAPTESSVRSVEALPESMQVRNFGKMNRTKYTHLVKEDTTDRNAGWAARNTGSGGKQGGNHLGNGCFNCGGPHMKANCPEMQTGGPSGANASAVRARRRSRSLSPRPSRDDGQYRPSSDRGAGSNDRYRGSYRRDDRKESFRRRSRSPRGSAYEERSRDRFDDRDEKRRRRD